MFISAVMVLFSQLVMIFSIQMTIWGVDPIFKYPHLEVVEQICIAWPVWPVAVATHRPRFSRPPGFVTAQVAACVKKQTSSLRISALKLTCINKGLSTRIQSETQTEGVIS